MINLVWGSMYIAAAIGLEEFPPVLFTAIRFALLSIVLVGFIRVPRDLVIPLLKIGFLIGVGVYLTLYLSIALAENTGSIAIFGKLEVPLTVILGVVLLKEKIGLRRIFGITIAMTGALLIGFDPAAADDLPALFWMAASSGFSALAMIRIRQLGKVHPLTITAWVSITGAPVLLITSMIFEENHVAMIQAASMTGWSALVYTAIMSSVIAQSGLFYLLQRYPVSQVTPFTLLSSVFAVIAGVVILDDQLSTGLVVGGVLILAGVAWINVRSGRLVSSSRKA